MSDRDDKARWKEEARQLKEDLNNRPKEVRRREVDIKFGGVKPPTPSSSKPSEPPSDTFLRRQLGL